MPLDTQTILLTTLSGFLSADTTAMGNLASLIPVAKQIDRMSAISTKREVKLTGAAAYPKLLVELRNGSEQSFPAVFGDNDATKFIGSGLADRAIPMTQQIAIVFTYSPDVLLPKRLQCEARVVAILNSKRPKFGLSWVSGMLISQWNRQNNVTVKGEPAPVDLATLTLTFSLRPMLSQLSA